MWRLLGPACTATHRYMPFDLHSEMQTCAGGGKLFLVIQGLGWYRKDQRVVCTKTKIICPVTRVLVPRDM